MGEWAVLTLMQDEDQDLRNLSLETVQKAIDAVKARAWDINPFTVADELKVSRTAVYRHADIMKQIIAARGGSFGMDVQTSLDLAWQLRQLEIQNNELKEKLAVGEPVQLSVPEIQKIENKEIGENRTNVIIKEADKPGDVIFNLANSGPSMNDYLNQLSNLSWKDIETVYHFKVSSLKDHARNLLDIEESSEKLNGESLANGQNRDDSSISYGSLVSIEANKRQNLPSSISPFARLKSGSLRPDSTSREPDSDKQRDEQTYINTGEQPIVPPPLSSLNAGAHSPTTLSASVNPVPIDVKNVKKIDVAQSLVISPEMTASGKRIEELESDLMRLASQLQNDLAERIRFGLADQETPSQEVQYREAQYQEILFQELQAQELQTEEVQNQQVQPQETADPGKNESAEFGGWLTFEAPKMAEQSGGWSKFVNQPPPTEPFFAEISRQIEQLHQPEQPPLPFEQSQQAQIFQESQQPLPFEQSQQAQIFQESQQPLPFEQSQQAQIFQESQQPLSFEQSQQVQVFQELQPPLAFEQSQQSQAFEQSEQAQSQTYDRLPKLHGFEHDPQSLQFERLPQAQIFDPPPLSPVIEQSQLLHQTEQIQVTEQPTVLEPEIKKEPEIKLIPLLKDRPTPLTSPNVDLIIDQSSAVKGKPKNAQVDSGIQSIIDQINASQVAGDAAGPRDELRDLIQSHIKNAAEQIAEFGSIGTSKEYEVWLNNPARSKFVGSTKEGIKEGSEEEEETRPLPKNAPFKPRVVPPDVRKACLILGLRPDNITYEAAQDAWKKAIAAPGVHPDLGGDTELAVYLNTAKDVLMRFLDAQAPKLGKKFGPFKTEKDGKTKSEKSEKPKDEH